MRELNASEKSKKYESKRESKLSRDIATFNNNRWPLCERRAHSGLESEENFGGDSDETPEHFGGLLAELSLRHGKQRTHLGKTSRLEMATKNF